METTLFKAKKYQLNFPRSILWSMLPISTAALMACGGSDSDNTPVAETCLETGNYACKTGETEPLYSLQWALNYAKSYFATHADPEAFGGGYDLNVEPVHRQGIKGEGVNVLVIDSGVQLDHEDLKANADYSMSWNYITGNSDPSPVYNPDPNAAHGTLVAGVIGAAQNGIGGVGVAPRVKIGGVPLIGTGMGSTDAYMDSYGNAPWARKAHIINASYGGDAYAQNYFDSVEVLAVRNMRHHRDGKGIIFLKAAGNEFSSLDLYSGRAYPCGYLTSLFDCTNPINDPHGMERNTIVVASVNAKGTTSSYSSAGSAVWISGLGGEHGTSGLYGEKTADIYFGLKDGPKILGTDISGCDKGYSPEGTAEFSQGTTELVPGIKDNSNCNYEFMNGTSSATPTISGVVALILSANPELTWRDVRDILKISARQIDKQYHTRTAPLNNLTRYGEQMDLTANQFNGQMGSATDIKSGSTAIPVELGWIQNAAGNSHSSWYGYGLPDAEVAVEWAQKYKKDPSLSKPSDQPLPSFSEVIDKEGFEYQKVELLGSFQASAGIADQVQVLLSGENICLGNLGIAIESPSGTKSILKLPIDHFSYIGTDYFYNYGLASYTFYGESAAGDWKVYSIASNPSIDISDTETIGKNLCSSIPEDGKFSSSALLKVDARVILQ